MTAPRAAVCPTCGLTFEATGKRRQRCPVCGQKFDLAETRSPGAGAGVRLEAPAYDAAKTRQPASLPASPITRRDRITAAIIFSAGSVFIAWMGIELSVVELAVLGVVGLALALRGALVSSFWSRYDDLSLSQRFFADLPRLVVWTIVRVLAAIIEIVFKILGTGFGSGWG